MKILMLNYEFPPLGGGAANATKYILEEFSNEEDLEIDLITSSPDEGKRASFSKKITIYKLNIGKQGNIHYQSNTDLLKYSHKAYGLAKKLKNKKDYDLIHAFFGIPCGYLAYRLNLPYIVSLRGSDVPFYNKRFYWLDRLFFKNLSGKIWQKADKVIANSKGLKNLAQESHSEQEIEVIPNGIDTKEFKPTGKGKVSGGKEDKINILSVGRLIPRKGFNYLIKGLKGLDNAKLTIVGAGPQEKDLKKLAKRYKVELDLVGAVDHDKMPEKYQKADIFVLPSLNEGMSNAVLEAMASGLPIITTDTGGTAELIKENGFKVKEKSPKEIKEAVEKYTKSENLIKKHRLRSRQIAKSMSWKNVADQYYQAYRQVKQGN